MPTKIIKPVDCLFSISAFILDLLKDKSMNTDELHEKLNRVYYKKIDIKKLLLCLNFLFICGKVRCENDVVKLKM